MARVIKNVSKFILFWGVMAGLISCLDPLNFDPDLTVDLSGNINVTDVTAAVLLLTNRSKTVDVTNVTITLDANADEEQVLMPSISFDNKPKHLTKKAQYLSPSDQDYEVTIVYDFTTPAGTPESERTRTLTVQLPLPGKIVEVVIFRDKAGNVIIDLADNVTVDPDPNDTGKAADDALVGEGSSPAVIPPENRDKLATFVVINMTRSQAISSVKFKMGASVYTMGSVSMRDKQSIALGQGSWETTLTFKRDNVDFILPAAPRPPLNSIVVPSNDPQAVREHYLYFYLNTTSRYGITEIWPPGDESVSDILPPDFGYGRGVIRIINQNDAYRVAGIKITNPLLSSMKVIRPKDFNPPYPIQTGQTGNIDITGTSGFPIESNDKYRIEIIVEKPSSPGLSYILTSVTENNAWIKDNVVEITIPPGAGAETILPAYTVAVTGGTLDHSDGKYFENETAIITAVVPDGKTFENWEEKDDPAGPFGKPTETPYSFTVTRNISVDAVFEDIVPVLADSSDYLFLSGRLKNPILYPRLILKT